MTLIGALVAIFGVLYVFAQLIEYYDDLDLSKFTGPLTLVLALLTASYVLGNSLLAMAWNQLLGHYGVYESPNWVFKTYFVSQIAKYVPGNIFHLGSRQVFGVARGLPGVTVAKTQVWELLLLACSGAIASLMLTLLALGKVTQTGWILITMITALVCSYLIIRSVLGRKIAWSWLYYSLYLAFSSVSFLIIFHGFANVELSFLASLFICTAFIVAWFVGFAMPGSPAGLGVREVTLLTLLSDYAAEPLLMLVILVSRFVSAAGDLLSFFVGSLISTK